jgi:putative iron-regulated protein
MIHLTLIISLIFLAACSPKNDQAISPQPTEVQIDSSAFAAQVGIVAYTSLSNASQYAQTLDSKLASFMYHPNPMSQEEIQQTWRLAYDSFLQSLIFSYLPIQDPPDWHSQHIGYQHLLTQLDSWPIEGGYIDYIHGYPYSGIVNDLALNIDETSIRSQHGFTDPTNASLGYHALEFMFWGNDSKRSPHDFFPQENTAPVPISDAGPAAGTLHDNGIYQQEIVQFSPQNHNRRRQYTQLLTEVLQKDLHRILRRWEPSTGYYAQLLQQSDSANTLQAAFIAAQNLVSQELLHKRFQLISSEFSNTSSADMVALLKGLELWFMPVGEEQQEASLLFLLQQADKEVATELVASIEKAQACLGVITLQAETIDQCRQDTIHLLSSLRNSAKALAVTLPALD